MIKQGSQIESDRSMAVQKASVIILMWLCFVSNSLAQNITRFEYFFDTDPGMGLGTQLSVTPTVSVTNLSIPIATSALSTGFHTLYMRSKNDLNQWTHTLNRSLCIVPVPPAPNNIALVEYFIDTDPGVGLATAAPGLTPATTLTNFPIDISATPLALGFHTLYVRSKTTAGQWTETYNATFNVVSVATPPSITSFSPASGIAGTPVTITGTNFSATPANNIVKFTGVAATVTASTTTSITVAVPFGVPTSGTISVTVAGLTAISSINFIITAPNIIAAEYFFNTDPGPGNGIPISITAGTTITVNNLNIPSTSLSTGWHTLCVRTKDSNNVWGFYECRSIFIRSTPVGPPPPQAPITAMEYFYDNVNDPGTGQTVSITSGTTVTVTGANLPQGLAQGWHTLHVRTKDQNNVWGFYETRSVFVRQTPAGPPPPLAPITAMEFFFDNLTDPGTGQTVTITSGTTVTVSGTNLPQSLAQGWHTLHVRSQDQNSVWGFYETRSIIVRPVAPLPPNIVLFEYFIDNDPGVGLSAFTLTKPPATLIDLPAEPLNVGTLSLGSHIIGLRAKDQNGVWSPAEQRNFTVTTGCPLTPPPSASNATRCDPGTLSLPASGAAGAQTYRWYADNTTLISLFSGSPFTTPSLTTNTNYFVSIYDPATYCESTRTQATAIVSGIPKPTLNLTGSLTVCQGNSVTLVAPVGFSSYLWSNGLTTQQITAATSGSYTVTVGNGTCTSPVSDPFTFTVNPNPVKPIINATGGGSLCGTGSVTLSAPAGYTTYSWSSGQSTQNIIVNAIGNFTVTVTDANGCQSVPSDVFAVTSTALAKPVITVTGSTTICGSGSVLLTAPGGFSSYAWSNGATTTSITISTGGSYSVTVSNGGCTSPASDATVVTSAAVAPQPTITVLGNVALCNGAFAVLSAPAGYSNYLWSSGELTQQIVVTTGGSFTVQMGNASTCMSIASAAVVTSLTGSACTGGAPTVTNASRCGTGSVSLTASGASGSQVYRWYDAPTSGTLVNSVASYITPSLSSTTSYYVAIYDPSTLAESSRTASTVTIVNISTPVIAGPGTVSICAGSSTLLSAPGGYITYLWSNGATTQQIQISTAANYSVQAGDGTCTSAISNLIVVSVVPAIAKPTISITGNTTLCGSGTVQLTAPVAPTYAWSNGATTQSAIINAAGSYYVALSNGTCTSPSSDPVVVTSVVVSAQPSIQITGSLALCSTGIVGLAAPTGSNNYLWSTLETTPQIVVTAAGAGVYSLQVGNASNCLSVASNTVTVTSTGLTCPTNGVVTPPSVTNNSRCDAGSVSLTASGAITGQVYRWYDLPTSGTLLFTGPSYTTPSIATTTNYYATIFDATNGESTPTMATAIVVIMPTPVLSGPGSIPICTGNNTLLSAPLGFVQYKWSNTVTTQQLQVNSAGSYSVQVGDGTCLSSASNLISVSVSPVITKPALTVSGNTTLCGSATVDLSAPPGYQYVWSTGANTQTVTVSSAGNYSVTLSNGVCTSPASDPLVVTSVTSPAKPSIVVTGTTALCNSAFVAMEAPGGFSNYLWSNGETTKGIVVSTAGSYKVQAGSAGTCLSVLSDAVIVTTTGVPCPSGITPPIATNGIRCGEGTVALNASGAAAGLAYRWYATATSTAVLFTGPIFTTPVLAGSTSYFTSVYDPSTTGESTRVLATATINSLPKPTLNKTGTVSICAGSSLVLSAPTGIAQYLWSNGAVTQQLSVTISGNYSVQTGDGTCLSVASDAVTVSVATVPTKPAVAVSAGTTALCGGGSVTLGAPAGFNYKWSDNSATQQITISKSGNFSVIVTNNAGCESVASDQIIVTAFAIPIKPSITVDGSTNLCIGAKVLLSAPAGFAAYHWSGGQTTQQIAVDKAGAYTVAVGNAASCLSISSDAIAVVETKLECIQPAPPGNHPPEIKPSTATTAIEGKISLNLKDLIRDADGNLNINSLRITQQPPSGAVATIDAQFNLHVDYTNIRFSGTEELTIQVCDLSNSCTQQEVTLQVAGDVEAFNALSPNGDGMNDKLLLEYIEIIPETKTNLVTIYNRWGNSIFEIVNYDNINHVFVGLDRNGNELPNDTYYYKIEFNSGKNSKEGFITLRR